jgi:hypothetical protein
MQRDYITTSSGPDTFIAAWSILISLTKGRLTVSWCYRRSRWGCMSRTGGRSGSVEAQRGRQTRLAARRAFISRFGHTITDKFARDADPQAFAVHNDSTLSMCCGAGCWSCWALTLVPGRTAENLQRHHTTWQIKSAIDIASSDAICSVRLGPFPSRPRRLACGALSGCWPLSSQYASSVPIRCLLNASRADMHWLAILAEPFCSAHSPACSIRKPASLFPATGWSHEAL